MNLVWQKPVMVFYKERLDQPEREAFLVIKARRLEIRKNDEAERLDGNIIDFFPLMGGVDYLSSKEGKSDRYVLCWFDDEEADISKSWRRLTGVTFADGTSSSVNSANKITFEAKFKAEKGKLR